MLSTKPDLEELLARAEKLSHEDRIRLIQRVAETLVSRGPFVERRRLIYGEFRGKNMSSEEDFTPAEWRPSEQDLRGP